MSSTDAQCCKEPGPPAGAPGWLWWGTALGREVGTAETSEGDEWEQLGGGGCATCPWERGMGSKSERTHWGRTLEAVEAVAWCREVRGQKPGARPCPALVRCRHEAATKSSSLGPLTSTGRQHQPPLRTGVGWPTGQGRSVTRVSVCCVQALIRVGSSDTGPGRALPPQGSHSTWGRPTNRSFWPAMLIQLIKRWGQRGERFPQQPTLYPQAAGCHKSLWGKRQATNPRKARGPFPGRRWSTWALPATTNLWRCSRKAAPQSATCTRPPLPG